MEEMVEHRPDAGCNGILTLFVNAHRGGVQFEIHGRTLSAPVHVCAGPAGFAHGRLTGPGRVATGAVREPDRFSSRVRLRLVNCHSLDRAGLLPGP